ATLRRHRVSAVADAKQTCEKPLFQTMDLDGELFNFRPIVHLCNAILQKMRECDDFLVQSGKSSLFSRFDAAFWNNESSLVVLVPIDEHEQFAVAKESE